MKSNWFLNIFILLLLSMGAESSLAQGLIISQKDGTQIKVPYEQLDYVTVYEGEEKPKEKKVVSSISIEGEDSRRSYDFFYNKNNQLIKINYIEESFGKMSEESNINYSTNEEIDIKVHSVVWGSEIITESNVLLNQFGNAVSITSKRTGIENYDSDCKYTYDNPEILKQFAISNSSGTSVYDFIWNQERIAKIIADKDSEFMKEYSFTYTEIPNKYNIDLNWLLLFSQFEVPANEENAFLIMGLIKQQGKSCKCMLKSIQNTNNSFNTDFSYECDQNGYINKITTSQGNTFSINYK